jgi:hypothetical protein
VGAADADEGEMSQRLKWRQVQRLPELAERAVAVTEIRRRPPDGLEIAGLPRA